jgi:tetratricopeptide (TPR) repeat protein
VESYRKAILILETLYQANRENLEIRRAVGSAYLSLGSMQGLRTLKLDEAIEILQKSLSLNKSLVADEPNNAEHRRMLADNYKFLGDALSDRDAKMVQHHEALAIREKLLAENPADTREMTAIASLYQRIGTILGNKADGVKSAEGYRETLEYFNKSLAIYNKLQELDPRNSRHRRNYADIMAMRLSVQASLGNKAEVMNDYRKAVKIFEELSDADFQNAEARLDLAYTHQFMCRSLLKLEDAAGALKICREGLQVGERLLEIDPMNAEARKYIFDNHNLITEALRKTGDTSEMMKNFRQFLTAAEKWLSGQPENVDAARNVINSRAWIGNLHAEIASGSKISGQTRKENWQAARDWFSRSLDALHDLHERGDAAETDLLQIKTIEQEIARCDAALQKFVERAH